MLQQDVTHPPSQVLVPATPVASTSITIKEEPGQIQHLPPAGSVDNPMEIDDSDADEAVVQGSSVTPKRRMKGARIADDLLAFLTLPIIVPPPGGETPGKRPKPASDRPSGSKDSTTSKALAVSGKVVGPSKQSVRGSAKVLEGSHNLFFLSRSLHPGATSGSRTETQRSKATGRTGNYFMPVWINSAYLSMWIGAGSPTTRGLSPE